MVAAPCILISALRVVSRKTGTACVSSDALLRIIIILGFPQNISFALFLQYKTSMLVSAGKNIIIISVLVSRSTAWFTGESVFRKQKKSLLHLQVPAPNQHHCDS